MSFVLPKFLQPDTVTIEDYEGDSAYGPQYGDPYDVEGTIERTRKRVQNEDGDEVISEVQFYTSEDIDPPMQSKLTFDGDEYEVINASPKRNKMNGQLSHVEVVLR